MDDNKFGLIYSKGNDSPIKMKNSTIAPWIAQLKSVFGNSKDYVIPYATKDKSFNDMRDEVDRVARIYFVCNGGKYRIFGLAKGIGEKNKATFAPDNIESLINSNPGKAFDISIEKNESVLRPFIELVKAEGCASQDVIDNFRNLCNSLIKRLGIVDKTL